MVSLGTSGFDADEHEPPQSFEPLPAGTYLAALVATAMKPTKKGTGEYLECRYQVLEGVHRGRYLFDRLNLKNPNRVAVEIAKSQLAAICRATGVVKPKDSVELHDIPLRLHVGRQRRVDTGEWVNEIRGYSSRELQVGEGLSPVEDNQEKAPWE